MRLRALVIAVFSAIGSPAGAEPLAIEAAPVQLQYDDPERDRIGALRYLGGFALKSTNPDFGGLSGLVVSKNMAIAVTDRGFWVRAHLRTSGTGRFLGVDGATISPILSSRGEVLRISHGEHDAEAVERWGDRLAVSFERFHRIGLYDPGDGDLARPAYVEGLERLARQPANGGIETLVALGDARLLAISEEMEAGSERLAAWLVTENGASALSYPSSRWKPTDGAFHPDVGVLVLERRFSGLGGFSARIRQIDPEAIRPGADLDGKIVARFEAPLVTDNFEGIAISEDASGAITIWLLSDDNFSFLQRNLLLAFRWVPG